MARTRSFLETAYEKFYELLIKVGLDDYWDALVKWWKEGQNSKILIAVSFFLLALFITVVYSCSQRPDV